MNGSLHWASLLALGSAFLGYVSRPSLAAQLLTTCVCRFPADIDLPRDSSPLTVGPVVQADWKFALLWLIVGILIAVLLVQTWRWFLESLRSSLELPSDSPRPRRPRALAP
jgi:hypothetical protein